MRDYGDAQFCYSTYHQQQLPEISRPSSQQTDYFKEYVKFSGFGEYCEYDGVNPNKRNVWKSLEKMWKKPITNINSAWMERAMRLVKRVLRPYFVDGLSIRPEIVMEAVPGAWWKYFGFKTKEEVLNSTAFYESWRRCREGIQEYPPYVASGKREFLTKEEIMADEKIRTFLIISLELLMDQKILYGSQDENMKKHQPGWIRYGVNFHDGGFDRFIKQTLSDFYIEYDVSGWDRLLPILKYAMKIRNDFLRESVSDEVWTEIEPITKRVTEATVNHKLLLPNGDVVQWDWSQMSGDGMTTSNNCLCHALIFCYLLIAANEEANDDEILNQLCNIYGDDVFAGITLMFYKLQSPEFVQSIYSHFGLTIKKGTFKCQNVPMGMSFLGATCQGFKENGIVYFAPSYKRSRIMTALQRSLHPMTPDDEIMKVNSLLEIGWFDCYDEIADYYLYLLRVIPDSHVKSAFKRKGLPTREEIRNRWANVYGSD